MSIDVTGTEHKTGEELVVEVEKEKMIVIFVEVDGKNKRVEFPCSPVTGRQIREAAGVPLSDDLVRLVHGKPTGGNICLDDQVTIEKGDRFLALPLGTVSFTRFPAVVERAIAELEGAYGEAVRSVQEGARWLIHIEGVELYPGCRPQQTPMLLVFEPSQAKPLIYVQPGQLLANGLAPKNSATVLVGGHSWLQFSFNIPYNEGESVLRFVASARQRFAQDE